MSACTLAVDLDGTFLGGSHFERQTLYQLIMSHDIRLIYVTGRGFEDVLPLLSNPTMPRPDFIICDVGATLLDGSTLSAVAPLQAEVNQLWAGEHRIEAALEDISGLTRQDIPHERRCSTSRYL